MADLKCPYCAAEYILGADRCPKCFHSLMQQNLPGPKRGEKIQKVMLTEPISELVTGKDLLVCADDDSVRQIIQVMHDEHKDCVLVFKKRKLVGIISQRDILLRVAGKHPDISKVKAADVMTPNPEFVRPEDPIAFVVSKMAMGGFRHVPVMNPDGTPMSIVSIKDVLIYLDARD
jgi:CBS domain-containing protein